MPSDPQQKFPRRHKAPPAVRFIFQTVPIGGVPWLVLFVGVPRIHTVTAVWDGFFLLGVALIVFSALAAPNAQREPGMVLANVLAGTSCIEGFFVLAYWMLSVHSPGAFDPPVLSRIDALYFSISTATTTGMGDIHPKSGLARLIVSGQNDFQRVPGCRRHHHRNPALSGCFHPAAARASR